MKQGAQRRQRSTSTLRKRLLRGSRLLGSTGYVIFSPQCPLGAAVALVSTRSSVAEEASCSSGRLCDDGCPIYVSYLLLLISCTMKATDALASSHSWFSKAAQLRRMSGVCGRGGILTAVAARAKPFHALGRGLDRISTVVRMSNGLNKS